MTNQETIEQWWQTHPITDTGWIPLANKCEHRDIVAYAFEEWKCRDCNAIARYEEFR